MVVKTMYLSLQQKRECGSMWKWRPAKSRCQGSGMLSVYGIGELIGDTHAMRNRVFGKSGLLFELIGDTHAMRNRVFGKSGLLFAQLSSPTGINPVGSFPECVHIVCPLVALKQC